MCRFCRECNGKGCLNQLPGMGGEDDNENFIMNFEGWKKIPYGTNHEHAVKIRVAPMTGAVSNIGYPDEKKFYHDMVDYCINMGYALSIGDGTPDFKLQYGIEAVSCRGKKAAVFIKPYENAKMLERFDWASGILEYGGIDIDAYNILTMRNQAKLEKKDSCKLLEVKEYLAGKGIPFVLKGIFTDDDLELVKSVKPDVAYVSNHGGRVPARKGSSAEFLARHADELKSYSGEIWVDGGIRSFSDVDKAMSHGVSNVLLGRPVASAVCRLYGSMS